MVETLWYEPGAHASQGLPHDPFKAIVAPRPIGWISTRSSSGDTNIAPYSFFNAVSSAPPVVMFSSDGDKDSVNFARQTGVFAVNLCGIEHFDAMNATSAPLARGQSEFDHAGLAVTECKAIDCPSVADAPAVLECAVLKIDQLISRDGVARPVWTVFGEVVGVRLRRDMLTDGFFDVLKVKPVSRLGYRDFSAVTDVFSAKRPGE